MGVKGKVLTEFDARSDIYAVKYHIANTAQHNEALDANFAPGLFSYGQGGTAE